MAKNLIAPDNYRDSKGEGHALLIIRENWCNSWLKNQ